MAIISWHAHAIPKKAFQPEVYNILIDYVYRQGTLGVLTSLFLATINFIGVYSAKTAEIILVWYACFIVLTVIRFILIKKYLGLPADKKNTHWWYTFFMIGTLFSGLFWGFSGSVVFAQATVSQQMLIVLIIAGITAGAVPLYSAFISIAFVFLIPSLLPLIVALFVNGNQHFLLVSFTVVAYLVYLIMLTFKSRYFILESVQLRFENDQLLNKLTDAANHDPLTQLANRSLFDFSLGRAINHAKLHNEKIALLYIDVDKFKMVNDNYGHHVGDQLLLEIVSRLKKHVRKDDLIARMGGDEVTIILEKITDFDIIEKLAKKLCETLAAPVKIGKNTVKITASIGVSIYPLNGETIDELLKSADNAMYRVKEKGGNNFYINIM